MVQETENLRLGDLISRSVPFKVLKYQRVFAWDEEEIIDFIKDIQDLFEARLKDPTKKSRYKSSSVVLTQQVARISKWDEDALINRRKKILEIALKVFRV